MYFDLIMEAHPGRVRGKRISMTSSARQKRMGKPKRDRARTSQLSSLVLGSFTPYPYIYTFTPNISYELPILPSYINLETYFFSFVSKNSSVIVFSCAFSAGNHQE